MNLEVTIKLDSEALSAINNLSAAIRSVGSVPTTINTVAVSSSSSESEETGGPIYWADNSNGKFGVVDTEAAYAALKKKAKGVYKITADIHQKKVEEAEANAQTEVKNTETKKTETKKTETKKVEKKSEPADEDDLTIEDVVAVFSEYLSKDLDAAERKERAGFVKPMLQRFGAGKASELAEEHFALAINLVKRKMSGEDIDPETAEFEEIEEDGLV